MGRGRVDMVKVSRFDVFLINLDPTIGYEIKKTRPCLVISPDELNRVIKTVIIAPMTSTVRNYPTRVNINFQGKDGQIAVDQLRTVDKNRLVKRIGKVEIETQLEVHTVLRKLFAP